MFGTIIIQQVATPIVIVALWLHLYITRSTLLIHYFILRTVYIYLIKKKQWGRSKPMFQFCFSIQPNVHSEVNDPSAKHFALMAVRIANWTYHQRDAGSFSNCRSCSSRRGVTCLHKCLIGSTKVLFSSVFVWYNFILHKTTHTLTHNIEWLNSTDYRNQSPNTPVPLIKPNNFSICGTDTWTQVWMTNYFCPNRNPAVECSDLVSPYWMELSCRWNYVRFPRKYFPVIWPDSVNVVGWQDFCHSKFSYNLKLRSRERQTPQS